MGKKKEKLQLARELFAAGERVCVAVSGGADSTALLLALLESNAEKMPLGLVLSAVHVHHGLRGADADADESFVRDLCDRHSVPLTALHVDTTARQVAKREGLEEAARELRYGAFRGILADGKADAVATAHTLDDQAETVMMKLLRGAWTEGLSGIAPVLRKTGSGEQATGSHQDVFQGRILRPLLGVRRSEIEAFLRERGQGWREDETNRDVTLTRNRVRHELMPVLRSYNPTVDELLANMAAVARDEEAHWEAELKRLLPQVVLPGKPVRGGGRSVSTAAGEVSLAVEIERLRVMGAALRSRVVRAAARSLGVRLSFEETSKLLALAGFGGHVEVKGGIGTKLELHGGLRAERSARELRMWRQ